MYYCYRKDTEPLIYQCDHSCFVWVVFLYTPNSPKGGKKGISKLKAKFCNYRGSLVNSSPVVLLKYSDEISNFIQSQFDIFFFFNSFFFQFDIVNICALICSHSSCRHVQTNLVSVICLKSNGDLNTGHSNTRFIETLA